MIDTDEIKRRLAAIGPQQRQAGGLAAAFAVLYLLIALMSDDPTVALFMSIGLAGVLIALTVVDIAEQRLPDALTLPLTAGGLAWTAVYTPDNFIWHGAAAAAGFALLYGLGEGYRRLRGHAGLGLGDAKLLAAAGAWLGLGALAWVLAIAATAALAVVAVMVASGREVSRLTRIPFGPFLALGMWIVWLRGPLV